MCTLLLINPKDDIRYYPLRLDEETAYIVVAWYEDRLSRQARISSKCCRIIRRSCEVIRSKHNLYLLEHRQSINVSETGKTGLLCKTHLFSGHKLNNIKQIGRCFKHLCEKSSIKLYIFACHDCH